MKAIPESLREALALRADTNLVPYAGGTDLMVRGSSNAEYLFLGRVDRPVEVGVLAVADAVCGTPHILGYANVLELEELIRGAYYSKKI